MREAPSIRIIESLMQRGARVVATDPVALTTAAEVLPAGCRLVEDAWEAAEGADALLVVTEWAEYREPDFERLRGALRQPVIFDGRNLYDPERMRELGFRHYSIGRPVADPGAAILQDPA
jgi:UDPglucose 6-dehydrogenase